MRHETPIEDQDAWRDIERDRQLYAEATLQIIELEKQDMQHVINGHMFSHEQTRHEITRLLKDRSNLCVC